MQIMENIEKNINGEYVYVDNGEYVYVDNGEYREEYRSRRKQKNSDGFR